MVSDSMKYKISRCNYPLTCVLNVDVQIVLSLQSRKPRFVLFVLEEGCTNIAGALFTSAGCHVFLMPGGGKVPTVRSGVFRNRFLTISIYS